MRLSFVPCLGVVVVTILTRPTFAQTHSTWADSTRPALFLSRNASPEYPEILRHASQEGEVIIELEVDSTGRLVPESLRLIATPHDLFSKPVVAAVRQWTWLPAMRRGVAVPDRKRYSFRFVIVQGRSDRCPPSYIEQQVICAEAVIHRIVDDWSPAAPPPVHRQRWWHVFWPF